MPINKKKRNAFLILIVAVLAALMLREHFSTLDSNPAAGLKQTISPEAESGVATVAGSGVSALAGSGASAALAGRSAPDSSAPSEPVDPSKALKEGEPPEIKDAWTTYLHNQGADQLQEKMNETSKQYLSNVEALSAQMSACRTHEIDPAWVSRLRQTFSDAEIKTLRRDIGRALWSKNRELNAACIGDARAKALSSEADLRTQTRELIHFSKGFILSMPHDRQEIGIARGYFETLQPYAAEEGPLRRILDDPIAVDPKIDSRVLQFVAGDPAFQQLFDVLRAVKLLDAVVPSAH